MIEMQNIENKEPIILKSLYIHRNWEGNLIGEITFNTDKAKTVLLVDENTCKEIIKLCANQLVESAKELSQELMAEYLTINAKGKQND